jgi:hypothetical protein
MWFHRVFSRFGGNNAPGTEDRGTTEVAVSSLLRIQREFFDLLKGSPVTRRIRIVSREKYGIDLYGLGEKAAIEQTTQLLESVTSFWSKHLADVQTSLQALPGRYTQMLQKTSGCMNVKRPSGDCRYRRSGLAGPSRLRSW